VKSAPFAYVGIPIGAALDNTSFTVGIFIKCTVPSFDEALSPPNTAQSYPPFALQLPVACPCAGVPVALECAFTSHANVLGSLPVNTAMVPPSTTPPNAQYVVTFVPAALQSLHAASRPGKKFNPCTSTLVTLDANTAGGITHASNGG